MPPCKAGRALILACLLAALVVRGAPAQDGDAAFEGPPALEWRVVFKLINVTSHAEPGELGFVREGDDTRESNEQSLRVQLTGQPLFWLDYRLDYLNVKQNRSGLATSDGPTGAALFRRRSWRRFIEEPEPGPPGTQTVQWFHEIDHAYLRVAGGPLEAVVGRQPISWGTGRIWQPTDVFATFGPLALDTEYKPGIDGLLLNAYPFDFASIALAYILSSGDPPVLDDSAVARWRGQLGLESELTVLAGSVREEELAGGSFETSWLAAGWRLEGIAFRPRDEDETHTFAIAGVDHRLAGDTLLLAELYYNTLGAADEADLPRVTGSSAFAEGRLLQLSRTVLALGASREFAGLWTAGYTLFGAGLRDAGGERHFSALHRLTLTYSISEDAEAVLSVSTAGGRGLDPDTGAFRSEFGHVPDSLYVSIQFVL
ncbi:MAG: hypothetical protein IIA41_03050 [SAR324 cluster bacterium]|nr:hypothetical protein [SAR324 cluster bacterium]